ncbi:MAG: hypothetical protein ACI36Z_01325 [Alloprevotella sp.]
MIMELLKKLYQIHSPSMREEKLLTYIVKWIAANVPEASVRYDEAENNLYVTKGKSDTYPCIVAHTDQVQELHPNDFRAVETQNGMIVGYSNRKKRLCGLGADDKNGIWIALKCLLSEPVLKVALFSAEEIGCIGSRNADMTFFDDCRFVLQADRRGSSDFITRIGMTELCTPQFVSDACIATYGYQEEEGMMTDVMQLMENGLPVCCANLSCGYYDPHTDHEFTVMADLENCLDLVRHIIHTCTEVYPAPMDEWQLFVNEERQLMMEDMDDYMRNNPHASLPEIEDFLTDAGYYISDASMQDIYDRYCRWK